MLRPLIQHLIQNPLKHARATGHSSLSGLLAQTPLGTLSLVGLKMDDVWLKNVLYHLTCGRSEYLSVALSKCLADKGHQSNDSERKQTVMCAFRQREILFPPCDGAVACVRMDQWRQLRKQTFLSYQQTQTPTNGHSIVQELQTY